MVFIYLRAMFGTFILSFRSGNLQLEEGNLGRAPKTRSDGTGPSGFIVSFMALKASARAISGGNRVKSYIILLKVRLSGSW